MPFIEENDLLALHKDIEKAQTSNEKLLDQIKYKNKDLRYIKPNAIYFWLSPSFLYWAFWLSPLSGQDSTVKL